MSVWLPQHNITSVVSQFQQLSAKTAFFPVASCVRGNERLERKAAEMSHNNVRLDDDEGYCLKLAWDSIALGFSVKGLGFRV